MTDNSYAILHFSAIGVVIKNVLRHGKMTFHQFIMQYKIKIYPYDKTMSFSFLLNSNIMVIFLSYTLFKFKSTFKTCVSLIVLILLAVML